MTGLVAVVVSLLQPWVVWEVQGAWLGPVAWHQGLPLVPGVQALL
jgi:hypothetical protein